MMKYSLVLKGLAVQLGEDVAVAIDEVKVEVEASAEEYMNSAALIREALQSMQGLLEELRS